MTAAWGALLRLARRDARRHPGRAALVVLLVALPVAGLVAAVTLTGTVRPSPAELVRSSLGAADLAVYRPPAPGDAGTVPAAGPPAGLPAAARSEPIWRGELTLDGPEPAGDPVTVAAIGVDLAGLGAGMFDLVEGRAPDPGTDQLALTEPLAQRLDAQVGSPVTTDRGPATVSGILTDPLALDRQAVVIAPDRPPALSGYLVDLPAGADPSTVGGDLQRAGWDATSPAELTRSDPEQLLLILVLGGFGFLVTSLVGAAAFAVSAQRRRHDLALLAATGAGTGQLRRSVLASALLLGAAGSAAGVGLGLLVPVATLPWLPDWTNRAVDRLTVPLPLVVAVAAVGVLTALAASWLTARSAGRTPVAAALTDRRPSRTTSARLLVVGVAGAGLGVAVTVATAGVAAAGSGTGGEVGTAAGLLLGSALTMLGLGAVSPWLAERLAGWFGRRLPVGVRLALRDTARFRSRTGPIVMAIVAGLGLSVAAGAALGTVQAGLGRDYRPQLAPDQLVVDGPAPAPLVSQLRTHLPVRADGPITIVAPADPTGARRLPEFVTVGVAGLLAALGAPAPAHTALRAGDVLVLAEPGRPDEAAALVEQAELLAPGAVRVVELDPVPQAVPPIVLSADTLERSGARPAREGTRWLVRLASPVEAGQLRLAQEQADRFGQRISVETGPPSIAGNAIQTAALAAAGVLSLLIVAVGLALVGQETRRDDAILTSVGAAPGTRRSLAAARATVLTALGAGLAVPAGLLPVWGLTLAARTGPTDTLAVPGTTIAATVLLVPAVAAGAAWLLTRPGRTTLPGHAP